MAVSSMGTPMTAKRPIMSFLPDHRGWGFNFPPVVDGTSKHNGAMIALFYHKRYKNTTPLIY
jgi:hypothetical protein